nr:MAG TPA: hypothetical protein [Caudoviricetes sp.]
MRPIFQTLYLHLLLTFWGPLLSENYQNHQISSVRHHC